MKTQQPKTCATAKSLQFCLTLCDPIDGSPPGSTIPGILQARILEWAAISFSKPVGHCKSSAKGKVHSNTGIPQETRKKVK